MAESRIEQITRGHLTATLYLSDCRNVLPLLSGIHACVTDPPYGLRFMGKSWDYEVPKVDVWKLVLESLLPGAHLLSFAGTRTQHRMCVNIEDAGFEIRDMIAWIYGSGFPKSHNLKDDWQGFGTALKPSLEPITVARKPLEGTVAENMLEHGTGALNIDGCRVEGHSGSGVWGSSNATCQEGRTFNASPEGAGYMSKQHTLGRWPANLIHDGSKEVLAGFPQTGVSAGGRSGHTAAYGGGYKREHYGNEKPGFGDTGNAARFFYCAKASKADRNEGCNSVFIKQRQGVRPNSTDETGKYPDHDHRKCIGNNHPTVKPTDLMRYLCRLVTPPGGIVLDPFMGSGSTGKAAFKEGFSFIGIERDPEAFEIAYARIKLESKQETLAL